jgi:hypothetical protein
MDSSDRDRKRAWKNEQKTSAQAAFPLPNEVLEQLFAAVDSAVEEHGCDHTFRYTEKWLRESGRERDATFTWLREHGGYCDCEVVANAYDHWEQNR